MFYNVVYFILYRSQEQNQTIKKYMQDIMVENQRPFVVVLRCPFVVVVTCLSATERSAVQIWPLSRANQDMPIYQFVYRKK